MKQCRNDGDGKSNCLPDLNGELSKIVPYSSIEAANTVAHEALEKRSPHRPIHFTYSSAKTSPDLLLKETTASNGSSNASEPLTIASTANECFQDHVAFKVLHV